MLLNKKIAVLGSGTMGPGIAAVYAFHGYSVALYSRTLKTLSRAKEVVRANLSFLLGNQDEQKLDAIMENVIFSNSLPLVVSDAGYIVETIVENEAAKRDLYLQLDQILPEDVVIASNTSYLDVFSLIPENRLTHSLIVHWYSPGHILPLVEIVSCEKTLESVTEYVFNLHRGCGKVPVRLNRYIPGFIVNRLQSAMTREVLYLIENGFCSAEDIDLAVKTSLMPRGLLLGVVERMDFNGLDMIANGLKNKKYSPAPEVSNPKIIFDAVEKGNFGVKTGRGLYSYEKIGFDEAMKRRDQLLEESVALAKQFMNQPLHDEEP